MTRVLNLCQASFADISDRVAKAELDGILLDLGVSSPQLDNAERGFGFSDDGPLDMRMDTRAGITAAEWLAQLLRRILQMSSRLTARSGLLSEWRRRLSKRVPVTDNADKAASHYCGGGQPKWEPNKHPATRAFQAIRIFINRELEDLEAALGRWLIPCPRVGAW